MEFYPQHGSDESLSINEMLDIDLSSWGNEPLPDVTGAASADSFGDAAGEDSKAGLTTASGENSNDMSWMQSVRLQDITDIVGSIKSENGDPSLIVDQSTGLPIGNSRPTHPAPVQISSNCLQSTVSTHVSTASSYVSSISQSFNVQSPSMPSPLRDHLQQSLRNPNFLPSSPSHRHTILSSVNSPRKDDLCSAAPEVNQSKIFPKPVYSYSCLIAMALKNSDSGCLPVSEIYSFMTENFPYFKTAPDGWKNSVRHNLSLNKCFEKIENPRSSNTRKGCLWGMNPAKVEKMEEEIAKWRKKDLSAIHRSMAHPQVLEILEKGLGQHLNASSSSQPSTPVKPKLNNNTIVSNNNHSPVVNHRSIVSAPVQSVKGRIQIVTNMSQSAQRNLPSVIQIKLADGKPLQNLTAEELSMLNDVDPTLSDLATQNGLFDDLSNEAINLEDVLPISSSPIQFSLSASSNTISSVADVKSEVPSIQSSFLYNSPVQTGNSSFVARAVSALT